DVPEVRHAVIDRGQVAVGQPTVTFEHDDRRDDVVVPELRLQVLNLRRLGARGQLLRLVVGADGADLAEARAAGAEQAEPDKNEGDGEKDTQPDRHTGVSDGGRGFHHTPRVRSPNEVVRRPKV